MRTSPDIPGSKLTKQIGLFDKEKGICSKISDYLSKFDPIEHATSEKEGFCQFLYFRDDRALLNEPGPVNYSLLPP